MAKHTSVITANGNTFLCNAIRRNDAEWFGFGILARGTFGGGTLSFFVSDDDGATLIPLKDLTRSAITFTGNDYIDGDIRGTTSTNSDVFEIWATLSGATSPSITVNIRDNR